MTSYICLFQQKQFSIVKSVKQQISYFSYFHPSIIILCKNLHDHMLCIFTPFIFTTNQQLFKIKQEDHIPSMLTIGLVFFMQRMSTQDQQNWNHIFITFLAQVMHFTRLKTFKKHLSSSILFSHKIPETVHFIFYQILHFMRNPTKFGSPKLDTPSWRYEILKHTFKSRK